MKKFFLFAVVIALLGGCSSKKDYDIVFKNPDLFSKTVYQLNNVVMGNNFSPIVASRNYLYASVASYEVIAAGYPEKYSYLNSAFVSNHLDLYLSYFTKEDGRHSIVNNPNSVYDQLLSEYGLLGLGVFFIFYLGFFIKKSNSAAYGIPLIIFLSAIFFVDYWFEQLSIVVFFELLFFLNLKEEHEI